MTDKKISELTELTSPDGNADYIAIVDTSATETKKMLPIYILTPWTFDPVNEILQTGSTSPGFGSYLQMTSGDDLFLIATNGDIGEKGWDAYVTGGPGGPAPGGTARPGEMQAQGGTAAGDGGSIFLRGGNGGGTDSAGGDVILTPGTPTGTGQQGFVILSLSRLPTADPGQAGAIYSDGVPSAGVPKVLKVSGG